MWVWLGILALLASCMRMLPMQAVRLQLGVLLAADPTTLAPSSTPNSVSLISSSFTPNEGLVLANLTLASFATSTAISGVAGTQDSGIDPATGSQIITLKAPAGGWRWQVTATTALPTTIYGFALTDGGLTTLLGVQQFPTPITLTSVGQVIDLGFIELTFVLQPVS